MSNEREKVIAEMRAEMFSSAPFDAEKLMHWADRLTPADAGGCAHGVRSPHECKECIHEPEETEQSIKADCYDQVAELLNVPAGYSVVEALERRLSAPERGEAVAWRSRMPGDSRWLLTEHEPSVHGIEKQPLHPAPASAALVDEAMVERVARALCVSDGGEPDADQEYECDADENPFESHPELAVRDSDGNTVPQWRSYETQARAALGATHD